MRDGAALVGAALPALVAEAEEETRVHTELFLAHGRHFDRRAQLI